MQDRRGQAPGRTFDGILVMLASATRTPRSYQDWGASVRVLGPRLLAVALRLDPRFRADDMLLGLSNRRGRPISASREKGHGK